MSVCLSIFLFVYLSVCLSGCLSICLSVYLSVCLSVYLSVSLSVSPKKLQIPFPPLQHPKRCSQLLSPPQPPPQLLFAIKTMWKAVIKFWYNGGYQNSRLCVQRRSPSAVPQLTDWLTVRSSVTSRSIQR